MQQFRVYIILKLTQVAHILGVRPPKHQHDSHAASLERVPGNSTTKIAAIYVSLRLLRAEKVEKVGEMQM
jgi:hypothetical protein